MKQDRSIHSLKQEIVEIEARLQLSRVRKHRSAADRRASAFFVSRLQQLRTALHQLEGKKLMTYLEIERQWHQRAHTMTLAEIEAEMAKLPATPKTDNELIGRAVMARRRGQLVDATRNPSQHEGPSPSAYLVEVVVPPGGPSCIQDRSVRGKYWYAEIKHGRSTIAMPWDVFGELAFQTANNTAGPNGGAWLDANPHLVDRLPKNPAPPPAAPPQ